MNLTWRAALFCMGITLILQSSQCDAGSRVVPGSDPEILAKATGAAHFEEHFEPIESSEESSEHRLRKRASDEDFDYEVYQGVVGRPGIDFPIHARIPQTGFSCRQYGNGYFADLETDCQVFHICDDGRKISFLCPNGTIFQQPELICDWWFKVNCGKSPGFYADSAELLSSHRKGHQRVENSYSSGKKSSYRSSHKSSGNKSQYPLKSSKRYEESDRLNQARLSDRRIDSEESVSVESVDFEDITEGKRTYHRKNDKFQASERPRENDNESQVVAETASFVGNNGRDNGYSYDSPASAKKSSAERGYSREVANQRPKSDRGRQKYDFRSNVYKNLNQPRLSDQQAEVSTVEPQTNQNGYNENNGNFVNNGNSASSANDANNGNSANNGGNGNNANKANLVERPSNRFSTPRPSGYTTARRFDITKTTPYYTPTVPTVFNRFGEYKSTPSSTTARNGFTPIISTPNPFVQRKGPAQFQQSERFNVEGKNDYSYSKPASFRAPSTTPSSIRSTYFTSDGRRPAVDIRLINGTVSSTPAYFPTTPQGSTFGTAGYDYSPFSTVTPNSVGYSQTKLSSPAPFSVFASGERTSSPVDVIIENRFESKKQQPIKASFSTPFIPSRADSIEILKNDQPTNDDVNIQRTTDLPVENISDVELFASNKNSNARIISTPGYNYVSPSTPPVPTSTNNFGFSTIFNDYTTRSPARHIPPKPEIESAGGNALDFKRNIANNGGSFNSIQSTTSNPPERGTAVYSTQGFATSTYSPSGSTYFPQQLYSPTSTVAPMPTSTVVPEQPLPTTYRPPLNTVQTASVADHIKNMIKTLNDLDVPVKLGTRTGLDIPSSSGPDTLHSLAEYFASGEATSTTESSSSTDDNVSGDQEGEDIAVRPDLSGSNLTGKTVHRYKHLFGLSSTTTAPEPTLSPTFQPNVAPDVNDLEGQHSSGLLGDNIGKTETRKLAQVFTNALSAYLQDPASFRKVLSEVRPTEPPATSESELGQGTAASYHSNGPTPTSTVSPATQTTTVKTGEGLEVLDYSDVTVSPGSNIEASTVHSTTAGSDPSTTQESSYANTATVTAIPSYINRVPASRFIAESLRKKGSKLETNAKIQAETESNAVAEEINSGLGLSTVEPYLSLAESIAARNPLLEVSANSVQSTTQSDGNSAEWSTTTSRPATVAFELLPPSAEADFHIDDDEDTLQRAQSQSFVTARNNLNRLEAKGRRFESLKLSTTNAPSTDASKSWHFITRIASDTPSTTEVPDYKKGTVTAWPATTSFASFVDPLTINDGLTTRNEAASTTPSPHTYLPRSTPSQATPINVDVEDLGQSGASTIKGLLHPDIPDDVLLPSNGIQRIANKMFGNLDELAANHLMSVMKKAESNETVRKLILLLIQTCDDDYGKTVEQSRKILLNALIGMDQKLSGNEEVQVFKLQPGRESRKIDFAPRSANLIASTEEPAIITSPQPAISTTTDYDITSTTQPSSAEQTTKMLIHVEDSGEEHISSTYKPFDSEFSTIGTTHEPVAHSTSEAIHTTTRPLSNRRRTKDVSDSLGFPGSDLSHKNSDERALELLKSLYSLASKFSRR